MTEPLDWAMGVVRHLESVATYPDLRAAFNAAQPEVSAFYSGIPLDAGLWNNVKAYAATPEAAAARRASGGASCTRRSTPSAATARTWIRPGKKRLEEIDVELTQITTKFAENVLDSTNAFELVLTNESDLAGLPPTAVASARESAQRKGLEGWRFTLQAPDYIGGDDVPGRRRDSGARCTRHSRCARPRASATTVPIIVRILELRREKAALLGFANFADLVLEDRMAHYRRARAALPGRPEGQDRAPLPRRESTSCSSSAAALEGPGAAPLAPWDVAYYAEKQRAALYDFDEEALRPYFPMERVVAGLFELVHRLYGISVEEEKGVPAWDPEVHYYNVRDENGVFLGGFYADWYPRENKRGGAWMDGLITGGPAPVGFRPHLGLICGNLTPPVGGKPALLTHREVETIFHEFGHLLHHLLSRVEIALPGRHQRGVGFRRAAQPDHGELVLGARGAGSVRAALRDRRADSRRSVPEDEARAHFPRGQRADAAAGLRLHRSDCCTCATTRRAMATRWQYTRAHPAGVQSGAPAGRITR